MKTLVIPDVHDKIWIPRHILKTERNYDRVVFLGDYFDSRGTTDRLSNTTETAYWLRASLHEPKHIHLWGNHDALYGFDSWLTYCGGYTEAKDQAIWKIMRREDFARLKFFHVEQGWLLSHAGLHPYHLPPFFGDGSMLDKISEFLTKESEKAVHHITANIPHWFFQAGHIRMGDLPFGGLLWCDSDEFEPIEGAPQIFGHTIQKGYPLLINREGERVNRISTTERLNSNEGILKLNGLKGNWNVCLDTLGEFYGIIQDGQLTIKPVLLNENRTT